MLRLSNIAGALVLMTATVVSACAPATTAPGPSASASGPKKGGTLILARAGEVTNLDPHKVPAFTSARVFELVYSLSLIHISEPTRLLSISYAVFCLKKKTQ